MYKKKIPFDIDCGIKITMEVIGGKWKVASFRNYALVRNCLLYTSDAADDLLCVDLGGRRII